MIASLLQDHLRTQTSDMEEKGEQERPEQTITQFISRWKGVRMIEANGVIAAIITIIGVVILFRELNTNIL